MALVAMDGVSALREVRDGRSAHVLVGPVHLHQILHVGGRVLEREGRGRARYRLRRGSCTSRLAVQRETKRVSCARR